MMRYISLFTGVGGLESPNATPALACEIDRDCWPVLQRRFPDTTLHDDVETLEPPSADVTVGGWPCQDLSVAGLQAGLQGKKSGLFFELLRVARESGSHTIIAENVPNLLRMSRGQVFRTVLQALEESGFPFISWRTLNAREFGLPHQRDRVFIVASSDRTIARSLHRDVPHFEHEQASIAAAGFYWTAGLQSICYSRGFVPTLKVGSSLSIPSPPALHFDGLVRKASPVECLKLQGFDPRNFETVATKHIYRMAGNAVAVPVGRFAFGCVEDTVEIDPFLSGFDFIGRSGYFESGVAWQVEHQTRELCSNLSDFIDVTDRTQLSPRASAGLLKRLHESKKPCPEDVREILESYARQAISVTG